MSGDEEPRRPGLTRRGTLRLAIRGALAALGLSAAGYAVASNALHVEPTTTRRLGLASPLRVVLISDLHAPHFWFGASTLREAVEEADADLVVVLGDVVDDPANVSLIPDILGGLPARQARLAIPGNWEHWAGIGMDDLRAAYAEAGFELLVNEHRVLRAGEQEVVIVGLDDLLGGSPAFDLIERVRAERPTLVLSHCPVTADTIADAVHAPVVVCSGHTHGGQLAPFGFVLWTPPGSDRFVQGWYPGLGGAAQCDLYVSRGLGCSKISARLGPASTLDILDVG